MQEIVNEAQGIELLPVEKKQDEPIKQQRKKRIVALRPSQVVNKKRVLLEFDGRFLDSFGKPEHVARWYITGPPFSGKSSLLFILSHYICGFGKVDYLSYEEGNTQTIADKIVKAGIHIDYDTSFKLLPRIPIADFKERLLGKRSAKFAVIDSIQHGAINKRQFDDLVATVFNPRRGKSLMSICHWNPGNDLNKHIKHDADIKIEVIGFVAHVESRYGGNKPFVIWEAEAKKYWGKKFKAVMEGRYWPGQKK